MMRLIDADALMVSRKWENCTCPAQVIQSAPTVEAVEVVRCKDCRHYKRGIVFKETMFCFRPDETGGAYVIRSEDDNFCSYGERRDDDV